MRNIEQTVVVDCEQCLREETIVTGAGPTSMLPEGWLEVNEGPPFYNNYQFCSPTCFIAWHERDEDERIASYNERQRENSMKIQMERVREQRTGR